MRIRRLLPLALLAACVLYTACGSDGNVDGTPLDASTDATLDAGSDAPPDVVVLGPVQCGQSVDDCKIAITGTGCFQARPGGVCANCNGRDENCPAGTKCIDGGTSGATECAFPCKGDKDCNVGMYCTGAGFCQPRRCSATEPCPSPYTFCRETSAPLFECARPRCSDGGCPLPLYCPDAGGFCLEP